MNETINPMSLTGVIHGNKRMEQMMPTAALTRAGVLPLFSMNHYLTDTPRRDTVNYYETGDYGPYVVFFKENHRIALENLLETGAVSTLKCNTAV